MVLEAMSLALAQVLVLDLLHSPASLVASALPSPHDQHAKQKPKNFCLELPWH
jgi:hypothetical protein